MLEELQGGLLERDFGVSHEGNRMPGEVERVALVVHHDFHVGRALIFGWVNDLVSQRGHGGLGVFLEHAHRGVDNVGVYVWLVALDVDDDVNLVCLGHLRDSFGAAPMVGGGHGCLPAEVSHRVVDARVVGRHNHSVHVGLCNAVVDVLDQVFTGDLFGHLEDRLARQAG